MKSIYVSAALAALIICTACGTATPTSLPTQAATAAPAGTPASGSTSVATPQAATLASGTPLALSGDTFSTSDPFHIASPAKINVAWQYSGKGQFSVWIENNSEFSVDPKYDRILIKNIDDTQSSGQSDIDLIAGDYVVNVEIADGPWQVTVKLNP